MGTVAFERPPRSIQNTIPKGKPFMTPGPCLYAVLYSDGVLKVGRTKHINQRLCSLRYRKKGVRVVDEAAVGPMPAPQWCEAWVLARLARMGNVYRGREYFTGVTVNQALHLIHQARVDWYCPPDLKAAKLRARGE